jgi:A/G-specific adenine glycosylase
LRRPRTGRRSSRLAGLKAGDGAAFGRRLRAWYRANARDLPWRRTRDPYRILVSELMLQQTQVARVVPRYHEFLDSFPTLADVARSSPRRVREAWEGLGYYTRARNLHRLARRVTANGREPNKTLPPDPAALSALPGIGPYTAGAVASFAYERRAPLVDTNVARVLRRVFEPSADPKSSRGLRTLWDLAAALLPRTGHAAWTHNQALMELGALVCTARRPQCSRCPVRSLCRSAGHVDAAGAIAAASSGRAGSSR